MQPARRTCICACNYNQLAAPASAHATTTSSPCLHLRMQLQPARRACICACNYNQLAAPASSSPRLLLRIMSYRAYNYNQLVAPASAHATATSPRTMQHTARIDNQPAAHHHHAPHTARTSQYFALVYLVRGTNFSKIQFIYISNCVFAMCS
jgi:hypothetical protein